MVRALESHVIGSGLRIPSASKYFLEKSLMLWTTSYFARPTSLEVVPLCSGPLRISPDRLLKRGDIFYGLIAEKIFPNFFCKMTYLGVILCEKRVRAIYSSHKINTKRVFF
jgi:hypothetical protein